MTPEDLDTEGETFQPSPRTLKALYNTALRERHHICAACANLSQLLIIALTAEIQSHQPSVVSQVVGCHHGDVVEGQVEAQGLLRYHGNACQSSKGAVTEE